jgi:TetR/AcrR family transcriptional repressor of nem operon
VPSTTRPTFHLPRTMGCDRCNRKLGDTTRRRIMRAAARKFAVMPYGQVNSDDVVAMADVTKGALYTHFSSKHALARAPVEHHPEVA